MAAKSKKMAADGEGKRLHGPAGRRTEITHSASEGVRRRMWSVLWVTLLLAMPAALVLSALFGFFRGRRSVL